MTREEELDRRTELWRKLEAQHNGALVPSVLRELGVYGGAQGIWVDKARTAFQMRAWSITTRKPVVLVGETQPRLRLPRRRRSLSFQSSWSSGAIAQQLHGSDDPLDQHHHRSGASGSA